MTVTAVRKNPQTLTMTLGAKIDASAERVWQPLQRTGGAEALHRLHHATRPVQRAVPLGRPAPGARVHPPLPLHHL